MSKDKSWDWYTNQIIKNRKLELKAMRDRHRLERERAALERMLRESVKNG